MVYQLINLWTNNILCDESAHVELEGVKKTVFFFNMHALFIH